MALGISGIKSRRSGGEEINRARRAMRRHGAAPAAWRNIGAHGGAHREGKSVGRRKA